jgi:hypothetical protein
VSKANYLLPTFGFCFAVFIVTTTAWACGSVGSDRTASSGRAATPTPVASPSIPASWKAYSDAKYGFAIKYPGDFTFKQEGTGLPSRGWLNEYRAVDSRSLGGYPTGQVEMGVYMKDSDSLTRWVQMHSDPTCGMPNGTGFFWNVTNLKASTAAGRDAVSFDVGYPTGCEGPQATIHTSVFFFGSNHIVRFDWWSTDPSYSPTIEAIATTMLSTLTGPS